MMDEQTIILLFTSDLHGAMSDAELPHGQTGGLARVATVIEKKREQFQHILLIDNGDLLSGSPLAHFGYTNTIDHPLVPIVNSCGFDAHIIGNHELDYGIHGLHQLLSATNFPCITANILKTGTDEPAFGPQYLLKSFGNITILVVGVTTYLNKNASKEFLRDFTIEDPLKTLQRVVPTLKRKFHPDVIVVSYHGGIEYDLITGEPIPAIKKENQGLEMLKKIPDIDILLTGHQHLNFSTVLPSGQIILQPGNNGKAVGQVAIHPLKERHGVTLETELIPTEAVPPSTAILNELHPMYQQLDTWSREPVISLKEDLSISDPMQDVWLNNHPIVQGIHRTISDHTGVTITCTPFFHNRPIEMTEELTRKDLYTLYPYANQLVVIKITGEVLLSALEHGASFFELKGKTVMISDDWLFPTSIHYHYEMWSGIQYTIDLRQPSGKRIKDVWIHQSPINKGETYLVGTTHYRMSGAGGYDMFHPDQIIREYPENVSDLLIASWQKWSELPNVETNCQIIY